MMKDRCTINRSRLWLRGLAGLAAAIGVNASLAGTAPDNALESINDTMSLAASTLIKINAPFTAGERIVAAVRAGDETWTLELTPRSVRSEAYQVWHSDADGNLTPVAPGPVNTYRGTVLEHPGSSIVGSILEGGLYASIRFDEATMLWVEPVGDRVAGFGPKDYVLYDNDDILPNGGMCGVNERMLNQRFADFGPVDDDDVVYSGGEEGGDGASPLLGTTYYAEIACDADFRYYQDWGTGTAARINSVINQVNNQYENQVSISHYITDIIIRTSAVYTSNDAFTLLSQFRSRWLQNHILVHRDVAHLFTGRSLNGGTIGIAWDIGAICNSGAYSLAESDCCGSFGCTTDLTAHELGHLWNGVHCSCENPPKTMNPFLTCANTFHTSFTVPDIVQYRNSRPCLDLNPPFQTGACCIPTGVCVFSSAPNCEDQGGLYLGDGTDCDTGECPTPVGGCCFMDGSCTLMELTPCFASGGDYLGNGSDCEPNPCPQPATGVCCWLDGSCSVIPEFACDDGGGMYFGDDANDCAGVNCPAPSGACCLDDGFCFDISPAICESASGTYQGHGTACADVQCGVPACAADLDGNNDVGFQDLLTLLSEWGPCDGDCPADLDGNEDVGFQDLLTLLSEWGPCP